MIVLYRLIDNQMEICILSQEYLGMNILCRSKSRSIERCSVFNKLSKDERRYPTRSKEMLRTCLCTNIKLEVYIDQYTRMM